MKLEALTKNAQKSGNIIIGLVGFCALLIILNIIQVAKFNKTEVIEVRYSPLANGQESVFVNKASTGHMEAWGYTVASIIGNVDHQNIEGTIEWLEEFLAPGLFRDIESTLREEAESIKVDEIEVAFDIRRVIYDPNDSRVYAQGVQSTKGPASESPDIRQRTYIIKVEIEGFRPVGTDLRVVEGIISPQKVQV
jgi:hypothetical protein